MTKKDYELIAGVINRHLISEWRFRGNEQEEQAIIRAIKDTALDLADKLLADNPKFDRNKFLIACGIGMPNVIGNCKRHGIKLCEHNSYQD